MPADSNWNTPVVSPLRNKSYTLSSSNGILFMSIILPWTFLMIRNACWITERFDRPKKSILSSPSSSTCGPGYCVASGPLAETSSGINLTKSSGAITTPQACTPCERIVPSSRIAKSITSFAVGLVSYSCFKSGSFTIASFSFTWCPITGSGTSFAILSASANGTSSTRATSRTAFFAIILPNVQILLTRPLPYFCVQYSITSSRRLS